MTEGLLAATDAVKRETSSEKINVIGYCVGGALLGTTLAYLAARGEEPFASATFFAAQVDFTKAGDLLLFIDDTQLKALSEMMAERGYLDGARMATVFNMLRPKDLITALHRQQLHAGQEAVPVRPAVLEPGLDANDARQSQLLPARVLPREQAGPWADVDRRVKLDLGRGEAADLRAVRQGGPHRAGQVGVHRLEAVRGPVTYVLAGSGHIAGVINPPDKPKYQYWTNDKKAATLDGMAAECTEHPAPGGRTTPGGSPSTRAKVPARTPGAKLGAIEDAPGSYAARPRADVRSIDRRR
jgi:polyhydroxyalkanoate synthase